MPRGPKGEKRPSGALEFEVRNVGVGRIAVRRHAVPRHAEGRRTSG